MQAIRQFIFLCAFLAAGFAVANSDEVNARLMDEVFDAAQAEDWPRARDFARQVSNPAAPILVEWMELREGVDDFARYIEFLDRHGDWPGLKRLRRVGEAAIPEGTSIDVLDAFLGPEAPQTANGALRRYEALKTAGQDAMPHLETAWREYPMTAAEQSAFLARFGGNLGAEDHVARVDNLLWDGRLADADRMLDLLPENYRALAAARMALQRQDKSVDVKIGAVEESLKTDPGLQFDRFQWRIKKGRWDDAQAFIAEMNTAEKMGRPEEWSNRRRGFARRAMRAGQHELAYRIARDHHLTEGSNMADLEWIAGYVALTHLNQPKQALEHFETMAGLVRSPISVGRAQYWLGRTHEQLGQGEAAQAAYAEAGAHQWAFYGQLGAEIAGIESDPFLAAHAQVDWRAGAFLDSSVTKAAELYGLVGDSPRMRWFMAHMAETLSVEETAKISHYARHLGYPYVALGVAKEAVKREFVLPDVYFPVTELEGRTGGLPAELALAIARRESEFRFNAESGAGALGLMQIMPATGRQVARELGLEFSTTKLRDDWRFNARLGTHYLAGLLEEFGGSYVLAIASYNAGPNRVKQWITDNGDPRRANVDVIDWIEHIPFRETRNYVMRVMEALHVYRARLGKDDGSIGLSRDLDRG